MQPGELFAGRFRLEEVVGTGGMGTVFRALELEAREVIAIKVLRADVVHHLERFAREIRVLAQLRHPGIVRYIADGQARGDQLGAIEEGEATVRARVLERARRISDAGHRRTFLSQIPEHVATLASA